MMNPPKPKRKTKKKEIGKMETKINVTILSNPSTYHLDKPLRKSCELYTKLKQAAESNLK